MVTPTSGLQTTEGGGQATFTVRLTTLPNQDVTVAVSSSDTTEGTVSPSVLTFTPQNARTPQTVTVTGVADGIADGHMPYTVILAPAVSSDPGYNNQDPADVSVTNADSALPPPPPCSPRPRISVSTAPESAGRLRVTLSATGANNTLSQVQVQSTANAEVEVSGQPPRTGSFVLPLGNVVSTSFVVHRLQAGQTATVTATVTDGCGSWPTFFGGGASGFP